MDMISNLPDEIICHIASFLSAKEAAFTTVISKRFLNLYNIIPSLEFDESLESFIDFVDRVLALPASTRIKSFSLKHHESFPQTQEAHINRCLCDVLNRGVLDLEIDSYGENQSTLPSEVFTCKTVIKLKLGCDYGESVFVVDALPENASLPALKTLILEFVVFKDLRGCAFEKIISSCHILKELIINGVEWEHWNWSGNLSSQTLERLTFSRFGHDFYHFNVMRITLNTPSLTYLEYLDVVPDEYPIVNLDSLIEAKLDLMLTVDHNYDGFVANNQPLTSNPTNLITGLRNVQIMNLTTPTTFEAFYHFNEVLLVFEKLHHLTITPLHEDTCWQFLPFLIRKTPNLETLTIDGSLHYDADATYAKSVCKCLFGYSFLLSCRLKVLEITYYYGTIEEEEQLKHYLEKLSCLKLVKLHYLKSARESEKQLTIPIALTTKCKIEVTIS